MSRHSDISRRGFLLGAAASAIAAQLPPAASLPEVAVDMATGPDMTALAVTNGTDWYVSAVEIDAHCIHVEVVNRATWASIRQSFAEIWPPNHGYELGDIVRLPDGLYEK